MSNDPVPPYPRYFTATSKEVALPSASAIQPSHIVDLFRIPAWEQAESTAEWAVVVDEGGRLRPFPAPRRKDLPLPLQAELNTHELAAAVRELDVETLYLFDVEQ